MPQISLENRIETEIKENVISRQDNNHICFVLIRDDLDTFMTAEPDEAAGTVCWKNGVDFDPGVLYENSVVHAELNNA
ncbi:hypothetical protein [Domibacillus epiphyticus]|uniref:hypothetical protein n=1 Tax=Domibacillus epiphyticus TaxID=1714355 RepID=UPI001185E4E1|nr:hypothetical protein [Domibacillus epiphyticus]